MLQGLNRVGFNSSLKECSWLQLLLVPVMIHLLRRIVPWILRSSFFGCFPCLYDVLQMSAAFRDGCNERFWNLPLGVTQSWDYCIPANCTLVHRYSMSDPVLIIAKSRRHEAGIAYSLRASLSGVPSVAALHSSCDGSASVVADSLPSCMVP